MLKYFALASLLSLGASMTLNGQTLINNRFSLSPQERRNAAQRFDSLSSSTDLALYGFYHEWLMPMRELPVVKKGNTLLYRLQLDTRHWQSHFYFALENLAPEDRFLRIRGNDSLALSAAKGTQLSPALHSGDELVLIDAPPLGNSPLKLEAYLLAPAEQQAKKMDFGDSEACQINAACSPEDQFPEMKRATVRYLWVNGSIAGWCSATLVNNTAYDYKAYLLSAEHCMLVDGEASSTDLRRWTFFFNYHSPNCDNPGTDQNLVLQNLVGCNLVARSEDRGGDFGSDFLLVELTRSIPAHFEPYFAGWSRLPEAPRRGISYHHPAGDIMKVSTFTQPASSNSFGGAVDNTHYLLRWSATDNGFGTSEPGSSGAALLNQEGLIRGTLTGGASSCSNTNSPDLYGRFDFSWNQNGQIAEKQLAPWLDPMNLGVLQLDGAELNDPSPFGDSQQWSIAPNPVEGNEIKLKGVSDFTQILSAEVYDFSGRLVARRESPPIPGRDFSINLSSQHRPGLYLVLITQGERRSNFRIWIL